MYDSNDNNSSSYEDVKSDEQVERELRALRDRGLALALAEDDVQERRRRSARRRLARQDHLANRRSPLPNRAPTVPPAWETQGEVIRGSQAEEGPQQEMNDDEWEDEQSGEDASTSDRRSLPPSDVSEPESPLSRESSNVSYDSALAYGELYSSGEDNNKNQKTNRGSRGWWWFGNDESIGSSSQNGSRSRTSEESLGESNGQFIDEELRPHAASKRGHDHWNVSRSPSPHSPSVSPLPPLHVVEPVPNEDPHQFGVREVQPVPNMHAPPHLAAMHPHPAHMGDNPGMPPLAFISHGNPAAHGSGEPDTTGHSRSLANPEVSGDNGVEENASRHGVPGSGSPEDTVHVRFASIDEEIPDQRQWLADDGEHERRQRVQEIKASILQKAQNPAFMSNLDMESSSEPSDDSSLSDDLPSPADVAESAAVEQDSHAVPGPACDDQRSLEHRTQDLQPPMAAPTNDMLPFAFASRALARNVSEDAYGEQQSLGMQRQELQQQTDDPSASRDAVGQGQPVLEHQRDEVQPPLAAPVDVIPPTASRGVVDNARETELAAQPAMKHQGEVRPPLAVPIDAIPPRSPQDVVDNAKETEIVKQPALKHQQEEVQQPVASPVIAMPPTAPRDENDDASEDVFYDAVADSANEASGHVDREVKRVTANEQESLKPAQDDNVAEPAASLVRSAAPLDSNPAQQDAVTPREAKDDRQLSEKPLKPQEP
ncbi:hypothetical protein KEM55_004770, partial [Ascosphaera atra]